MKVIESLDRLIKDHNQNKIGKRVVAYINGVEIGKYPDTKSTGAALGFHPATVSQVLNKNALDKEGFKTKKGYSFEWEYYRK